MSSLDEMRFVLAGKFHQRDEVRLNCDEFDPRIIFGVVVANRFDTGFLIVSDIDFVFLNIDTNHDRESIC